LYDSPSLIGNSRFTGNLAAGTGGAIAYVDDDLISDEHQLIGCRFQNNNSHTDGGSVSISGDATILKGIPPTLGDPNSLVIDACDFLVSEATDAGGGLFLGSSGIRSTSAVIRSCTFDLCEATRGGAVAINYRFNPVELRVENSNLGLDNGNFARSTDGGAIAVFESGFAFGSKGIGALAPVSATLTVVSSTFVSNVALKGGGAISIERDTDSITYTIESSIFILNRANTGGAVFVGAPPEDFVGSPLKSEAGENEKGDGGFGFPLLSGAIRDNSFIRNSAPDQLPPFGRGGAVYLASTSSEVVFNSFVNNLAPVGGGVHVINDTSRIENNRFGDPLVEDTFQGNLAQIGGGLTVENYVVLKEGARGNQASKGSDPSTVFRALNNLFYGNFASVYGGGLAYSSNYAFASAGFLGNVFIQNTCPAENGFAIAVEGSAGEGVVFAHNTLIDNYRQSVILKDFGDDGIQSDKGGGSTPSSVILLLNGPEPLISNNIIANSSAPADIPPTTGIAENVPSAPLVRGNNFFNLTMAYFDDGATPLGVPGLNALPEAGDNTMLAPLFQPPGPESFGLPNPHLSPGSPLIDSATQVFTPPLELTEILPEDIDGLYRGPFMADPRIVGGTADVGADEFVAIPTPTPSPSATLTQTPEPTSTSTEVPTLTSTPVPTATQTPDELPTATNTPGGAATSTPTPIESATATATNTPGGPTETPTLTPIDCDVVEGNAPAPNPRCDCYDLIAIITDQRFGIGFLDTDFDDDGEENWKDLFLFSQTWYRIPSP
jgi:hypothetical protein